jgi:hypothetical protein
MDTKAKFHEMRAEMYRELGTTVTTKAYDRRVWKTLDVLLRIVSFGKLTNFMKRTTTLGRWIAFGEDVDLYNPGLHDLLVLRHERRHVVQGGKYTWLGLWWLYLFFPLPIGLAYFRYKFEREALMDEIAYAKSLGLSVNIDEIIEGLSGPAYVWMWPKKWIEKDLRTAR